MKCCHHTQISTWDTKRSKMITVCKSCDKEIEPKKSRIWAGDVNSDAILEFEFECLDEDCDIRTFVIAWDEPLEKIPGFHICSECSSKAVYCPNIQIFYTVQGEGSGAKETHIDRVAKEKKWLETEVENTRKVVDTGGTGDGASPYSKYTMDKEHLASEGRLKRVSTKEGKKRKERSKKRTLEQANKISELHKPFVGKRNDG